jgi:hypothetical protein
MEIGNDACFTFRLTITDNLAEFYAKPTKNSEIKLLNGDLPDEWEPLFPFFLACCLALIIICVLSQILFKSVS